MRTFDYVVRVSRMGSRHEDDASTMTLEDQRERCREMIVEAGGVVGREHKALNQSGFTSVDSAPFRAALGRAQNGDIVGVAFAYSDRMSRNGRKVGRWLDDLEEANAELLLGDHPDLDYRSDEGRLVLGVTGYANEIPHLAAKKRGKRNADRTLALGIATRVPFGYRRNGIPNGYGAGGEVTHELTDPQKHPKALVPDPETAPLVQRVFAMRGDGVQWARIVEFLEESGARPRSPRGSSGNWTVNSVRNMIANDVYTGTLRLGEREPLRNAHDAIVDRRTWVRAQSVKSVVRSGRNAAGLAGGLLHCEFCGGVMAVTGSNPAYSCRRTFNKTKCATPVSVSKKRADDFVERLMVEVFEGFNARPIMSGREINAARRALEDAQEEFDAFVAVMSARDAGFKTGLDSRQERVEAARQAYEDAVARAGDEADLPSDVSDWTTLDAERRRRVARVVVDRIEVGAATSRGPGADVDARFTVVLRGM
jgi:hypothetical protein